MEYFNNKRFFKVMNAASCSRGIVYDVGLNNVRVENTNVMFVELRDIFDFIYHGPCFREIFVPDETCILMAGIKYIENEARTIPVYFSDKVVMSEPIMWTVDSIKSLINLGADISINNYHIVAWALMYNYEVFYFLQEYICNNLSEDIWDKIVKDLTQKGLL